jgi:predicted dehydrogenase
LEHDSEALVTKSLSRRLFVGAAGAAAARRVLGANDRISVGVIGAGSRGRFDMEEIARCAGLNAAATAVCDVYRPNLESAVLWSSRAFGAVPRQTADYRELLSWKEVDAVVIATPDFGHATILKAAIEAGKDVYCEKPFATDFAKAKAAYLAIERSGRVVQVGTQRRSDPHHMAAAKFVRSGGLGRVTRVAIAAAMYENRWARRFDDVRAEDLDWDLFLMDLPRRPFDARLFRRWQLYRATTNGIPGLWMSHLADLVHWYLDDPYPAGAVAAGGVYLWKDGRETDDVFEALLDYSGGCLFSFTMALTNSAGTRNQWFGTRGTLEAPIDTGEIRVSGTGSGDPKRLGASVALRPEAATSHMHDFLLSVRSRNTPRADYRAGFSHAVAGCMAAQALANGRRMRFDRERLEIV